MPPPRRTVVSIAYVASFVSIWQVLLQLVESGEPGAGQPGPGEGLLQERPLFTAAGSVALGTVPPRGGCCAPEGHGVRRRGRATRGVGEPRRAGA